MTPDSPPQTESPALAWSPDGGSVVYDAGDDNADLYVVGVDGRGRVRLTNTPDGEVAPSWVAR